MTREQPTKLTPGKCCICGIDLDPDEYAKPEDATLCGYCIADRMGHVRGEKAWPPILQGEGRRIEAIQDREINIQATLECYLHHAETNGMTERADAIQLAIDLLEA